MIKIKLLNNNKQYEVNKGVTVQEFIHQNLKPLIKKALACKINHELKDLTTELNENCELKILTFEDPEGKQVFNHSAAHVLASAVVKLWPNTKPTIGPANPNNFFYDFHREKPFDKEEIKKIERKVEEIIKADYKFERIVVPREKAFQLVENNKFKKEILQEEGKDEEYVSFYKHDDFIDLCRGPHIPRTGLIKAFKITNNSSSYWRGDEKREVLRRLYGVAFPKKKLLEEYLKILEEAEKRDHRKLGKELDLFVTPEKVGPGLPILTPRGTIIRNKLIEFIESVQSKHGYTQVWTPHLTKNDLYKTSGHWDKYGDNLFKLEEINGEKYAVKPMNCPHHIQIYLSKPRSYKELPLRLSEFATVYRNEKSGEMHGLLRVRSITQDDSHIFCREDQIEQEINIILTIFREVLKTFGFKYKMRLSKRDPNNKQQYLGSDSLWEKAETILKQMLEKHELNFFEAEGEAAFYGPKIDIIVSDALNREWQLGTVQLDFNLPQRFKLEYVGEDNKPHTPVMIHRAILGSIERFMGILIEHYAGAFPTWISPVQVMIIPVNEKVGEYVNKVKEKMIKNGLRVVVNDAQKTVEYRVRESEIQKTPYTIVIGEKEVKNRTLAVRPRSGGVKYGVEIDQFIKKVVEEVEQRKQELSY